MQSLWQPISEAPLDGDHVLLYCPSGEWGEEGLQVVGWYGHLTKAWYNIFGDIELHPTHFLPLPTPPGASK